MFEIFKLEKIFFFIWMNSNEGQLIRINKRSCQKYIYVEEDTQTIPVEKRPRIEELLHLSNYEVNSIEKVQLWITKNTEWYKQPVWIPEEHPSTGQHDTFIHTYELGNDAEHPIYVEDDGWFTTREVVSDFGVCKLQYTWDELPEFEKRYWQKDWWYEKPWEELKDPGAMSEESDKNSL